MPSTVTAKGPMFDGSAGWMLTAGIDNGRRAIAAEGERLVKMETGKFRNPTGTYESRIHQEHAAWISRILPGRLPYVRWLEGTSRRNQTTRFKGYFLFRNARMALERRAVPLMEQQLEPIIRKLNG